MTPDQETAARATILIATKLHDVFTEAIKDEMDKVRGTMTTNEFTCAVSMALASSAAATISAFAPTRAAARMLLKEFQTLTRDRTLTATDKMIAFRTSGRNGPVQ